MEAKVTYRPVAPVKPAAGYIGGKKQLARAIIERIERVPHITYAEPFVGMGGVFFRRRCAPRGEVINDRSGDVATFFRVLQRHYVPFVEMLRWQITSRREFERLKASDPATLTDLERAARFLYLQRTTFGGKVDGRTYGLDLSGARFNVVKLGPMLEELHDRLTGVVIEQLDWAEFLRRYDRPTTLFYLDPPYWGCEAEYGGDLFRREDFGLLAEALAGLQGRFIMTLNDVPEVQRIFAAFRLEPVGVTYTMPRGPPRRAGELIITGGGAAPIRVPVKSSPITRRRASRRG